MHVVRPERHPHLHMQLQDSRPVRPAARSLRLRAEHGAHAQHAPSRAHPLIGLRGERHLKRRRRATACAASPRTARSRRHGRRLDSRQLPLLFARLVGGRAYLGPCGPVGSGMRDARRGGAKTQAAGTHSSPAGGHRASQTCLAVLLGIALGVCVCVHACVGGNALSQGGFLLCPRPLPEALLLFPG